jgi:DNA-3-methyladenine glycosylase I
VSAPLGDGLLRGVDGVVRCWWCGEHEDYVRYHDLEWGVPVTDEVRLFEKLALEGFQAGLSWLTILRKRENFRAAFAGFDPEVVSRFGARDVKRLLADSGIVRHRGKIEATISNARAYLALREETGSLRDFVWQFASPARAPLQTKRDVASESAESRALSKALKQRGWRFVGPTTLYAFFQAMGLVNDHLEGCTRFSAVAQQQSRVQAPRAPGSAAARRRS